jgi:hypothetical protein
MPRICQRESCDKSLPPTAAAQRKYCSTRCQVAEWRRKQREQEAK